MSRWLAALFSAFLICTGTLSTAQPALAALLSADTPWLAAESVRPAEVLLDAASEPVPSDAPLELPEFFDGPRPLHQSTGLTVTPKPYALAPPPAPFLEHPQRPPRFPN